MFFQGEQHAILYKHKKETYRFSSWLARSSSKERGEEKRSEEFWQGILNFQSDKPISLDVKL